MLLAKRATSCICVDSASCAQLERPYWSTSSVNLHFKTDESGKILCTEEVGLE